MANDQRDPLRVGWFFLMDELAALATKPGLKRLLATLDPKPRTEEEWIDLIGRMTVAEFAKDFEPGYAGLVQC